MRSYLLTGLLLISCLLPAGRLFGQRIDPTPISDPVCLGASLTVPFTVQGRFTDSNVFSVQLRNSTTDEVVLTSATVTVSPAQLQLPVTLPGFTDVSRYQYRIVGTSPAVSSDWQRFSAIQSPASITIASGLIPLVNPGQPYALR